MDSTKLGTSTELESDIQNNHFHLVLDSKLDQECSGTDQSTEVNTSVVTDTT
jgi:hypothetical protein